MLTSNPAIKCKRNDHLHLKCQYLEESNFMKNYSAKLISAGYNNYTLLEPYKIIDIMY
jgi:hypothetical protein